jgi:hypothetical protein
MSETVITRAPVRGWNRTGVIVGLFVVVAIGVGAAIAALSSGGSESSVRQAAPAAAPVPPSLMLCGNDATNLVATMATLPGNVQAEVVGKLSPQLANAIGTLASYTDASALPPAPDTTTLGAVLTRVGQADRNTIIASLPADQGAAVSEAWQSANTREYLSSTPTPCS